MSVHLQSKWLRIRILFLSHILQIWCLLQTRSFLTFWQTIECRITLKLIHDMIIIYNSLEWCKASVFLELDCSHSWAEIFLLETDLPKAMNNQCFYICCIKVRSITWIKKKNCLLSKSETCILLFQEVCRYISISFIRCVVNMNLVWQLKITDFSVIFKIY